MNVRVAEPLLSRAFRCFGWKLLLLVVLPPLFECCYVLPQLAPVFNEPYQMGLTWVDRVVPFEPAWVGAYLSVYLMVPLAPLFATTRGQLWRYTLGMAVMFVGAGVFFFCCPVAYPRPPRPAGAPGLYLLITSIDKPLNAMPSLHAGMAAYTLLYARRILADLPPRQLRALLAFGWVWTAVIFYATLATKQHYLLDLPAGMVLAWVGDRVAWRVGRSRGSAAVDLNRFVRAADDR
ncbi:MAG TPA: phosphatase PAP2 family protein [Tepidisphaeraceae bacterium]